MFSDLNGVITLPDTVFDLKDEYMNDLDLFWIIVVDEDYSLELKFIGDYNLQPGKNQNYINSI